MVVWSELARQDEALRLELAAQLRQVVTQKQTSVSQTLVKLLDDNTMTTVAADWLDYLMAEIPGNSVYIARYPVTNAQYRRFVAGDGYHNQKWWSEEGWQWRQGTPAYDWQKMDRPDFWEDEKWNGPACPVVGVTWYEAEAYCNWLSDYTGQSFRLPSEAEWQRAAQGGDNRTYPWGDKWEAGRCNTVEAGIGRTTPVGQFSPVGDSPTGCADMSGNVWEWCADWYDKEHTARVLRGGSWGGLQDLARCVSRGRIVPRFGDSNFGFRVVSPILLS